ncbi:MAG: hypothetical protein KAS93_03835 [Gammaproteobacteria bacterium]|nr:hypothetical protein [Gammaproteobacteria bacterium]
MITAQHILAIQNPDNRRWFMRINRSASCLEITSIVDNGLLNTKPKLWQLLSNFESSIKTIRIITPTISTDEANQIVASLAVITPKKMSIRFMTEEPSNLLEIHCNHISQEARKIIQQDSRVNVILPKASTSSQPTSFTM